MEREEEREGMEEERARDRGECRFIKEFKNGGAGGGGTQRAN